MKQMLICILSQDASFTKIKLQNEFQKHFGIELDFKSNYIQSYLDKLQDEKYFTEQKLFSLSSTNRDVMYHTFPLIILYVLFCL